MIYDKKFKSAKKLHKDKIEEKVQFGEFCKKFTKVLKTKEFEEINEDDFKEFKSILTKTEIKDTSRFEQPDCKLDLFNIIKKYITGEKATGFKTNKFKRIEKSLNLWQPGLYLVGGDANIGKTNFMLNVFLDILESNDDAYGIMVSMDDMKQDIYTRLVSIATDGKLKINEIKDPTEINTATFNMKDRYGGDQPIYGATLYENAVDRISGLANDKFLVFDANSISDFEEIEYFIKKSIARNPNKKPFVIIDGLFNVEVSAGEDARNTNIKRANLVKHIADKYDIMVMASVELVKAAGKFGYVEPKLSSIMETGKFAYNAKVVIMLCFNSDDDIDSDKVYVKAKFVKNKISSFRGSQYLFFNRPCGYINENGDREKYEAQWAKTDNQPFGSGFVKNQ